ncbi:MAG: cation-translocating P-type ATPase [Verrucomicrobiota bacterium]|nr:cation-translocating P-type ATPase [Verrucomicrobiota bacterium]MCC6820908.1 cation-translocating P-type ATPase [Limisphaerales bacterium]
MQVTSLLSQHDHEHGPDCSSCGHDHEHASVHLWQTMVGVVCVLNAFVVDWAFDAAHTVASASAFIGAILLGYPIVVTAIKDLKRGHLSINELVAIAVLAAFASGDYKTAGVVAFFMLLGEIIETRTAEGARASIESLIKLTPTKARRIKADKSEEEVAASQLAIGDVIRIRPGDNVAADGLIVNGQGSFNQATITGESLPVDKKQGDEVFAGTQNLTGVLEIKVSRAGTDTTLGRVRELILAAEKTKLPIMKIVDQYMGLYTPLVLVIGALVWAFTHDLNRVIAVLVVSCPCAFILATPTAMVAALSAAARLGILIKNVADIEAAAKINAFIFDKTGTLTTGELAVSRLMPLGDTKPAELLRIAASAEKYSNHPTAKALALIAGEAGVTLVEPQNFAETAGRGVKADIGGTKVFVGRAQWLKDNGIKDDFEKSVDLNETEGWSLIFVARDNQCIGWVGLQDQTRAEAKEALTELREAGVRRIAMVSGDRQPVATRVAAEIGCEEAKGECLPQNKVEFVRAVKAKGYKVAVIGDGVNDAPALAAGDIGIAMGAAGSEVAIHSATIALMNNDLRRLPFLVKLSRSTRAVINQNFLFGVLFIIVGLSAAAFGYLNPIIAAILHNVGSLIVIFNSARLVRKGEELEHYHPETTAPTSGRDAGSRHGAAGQLTPKIA